MVSSKLIQQIELTNPSLLQGLVESRRVFNLTNCEMNVYESYQQAFRVPLRFNDFVITSMMRGKKMMHLHNRPSFEYLPGESMILPANETMVIDFPEAGFENPVQCMALTIDEQYVKSTLHYLDTYYNNDPDEFHTWKFQFNQYHFENDSEVTEIINKLIRICSSTESRKNIYADLNLKELLIRLLQSQHLLQVKTETKEQSNQSRLHYVLHYINEHLTDPIQIDTLSRKAYFSRNHFFKWFREQFGTSPLEFINRERIKLAKQLLTNSSNSITSVSLQCGFTDVNYFVRLFKKSEGITPGLYQACLNK